jgi:hypothetical protein
LRTHTQTHTHQNGFVCTHHHRWLLKSRAQNGDDIAKNDEQEEKRWTARLFFGFLFVVVVVSRQTHQNPF